MCGWMLSASDCMVPKCVAKWMASSKGQRLGLCALQPSELSRVPKTMITELGFVFQKSSQEGREQREACWALTMSHTLN